MNKKQEICTICLDEIQKKDNYTFLCGHNFHNDCVNKFIKSNIIILNNDTKKWAYLSIEPKEYGFKHVPIMGLCDNGSFACPVCRKNYTLIHDTALEVNMKADIFLPIEYICKIKYATDNADIHNLWYSHYIVNMSELKEAYLPQLVNNTEKLKLFDHLTKNIYSRTIKNIMEWHSENKTNENLILHAINCGCDKEKCLGFFFVKEMECPLCKPNVTTVLSNHMEHLTPKQLENYLIKWDKILVKEMNERELVFTDSDSDVSDDSDSSRFTPETAIIKSFNINNRGRGGRGRGRGRGGRGRGRGRGN